MYYVVEMVRELFGFTKYEFMIATLSIVFMLSNFLGGMLYTISLAFGRVKKELPLRQRLSIRLFLLWWFFLLFFAVYFHTVLYGRIASEHVTFWVITLAMAPALTYFGAQLSYVMFQKKIDARRRAYKKWLAKRRAGMAEKKSAAVKAANKEVNVRERKKKMDAEVDAKIAHARKYKKYK